MSSPASRASRRAVLAGGTVAGAALLAGCGSERPGTAAGAPVDDPTAPAVDADSDLVARIGDRLAAALGLAAATSASVPQVRPLARRLAGLHRAHLDELGLPGKAEDGRVKGTAATARARLLRSEERLQEQLVRAALDAESGALAQVFASMAAAVAQERAVAS